MHRITSFKRRTKLIFSQQLCFHYNAEKYLKNNGSHELCKDGKHYSSLHNTKERVFFTLCSEKLTTYGLPLRSSYLQSEINSFHQQYILQDVHEHISITINLIKLKERKNHLLKILFAI